MAVQTYYGSNVADSTLSTACDMASASGGGETSVTTTTTGSNDFAEVLSQGGTTAGFTSIPGTPTGKGWVFQPGLGTFALGNWSASITLSNADGPSTSDYTLRFSKYSGGLYTIIGSINTSWVSNAKQTYTFAPTSMPSFTFGASDLLYAELWWHDTGGIATDNPTVYVSTSSSAGVASDFQITTSDFTPGPGLGGDPTIYGSTTTDATIATACDMASSAGGVETSVTTTSTSTALFVEIRSHAGTDSVGAGSIPANPTGRGWVFAPGAGTIIAGNWSTTLTLSGSGNFGGNNTNTVTFRAFQYSAGVYTPIGTWPTFKPSANAKTIYTLTPASFAAVTFAVTDLLYFDLWMNDTTNVSGDNPVVWVSTSSSAGVPNDLMIVTANFIAAGASLVYSPHKTTYVPRALEGTLTSTVTIPSIPRGMLSTLVTQYVPRPLGGTLMTPPVSRQEMPYFIPRAFGSTLVTQYIPRAFGGTIITPAPFVAVPTNNSMSSEDDLVVSDSATLFADGASATDGLTADDSISSYAEGATLTDALSTSDSIANQDGANLSELNTASDLGNGQQWNVDALTIADSPSFADTTIPLDTLSAGDSLLGIDGYGATDALSADDSASSMVQSSAGITNNPMSSEDDLVVTDAFSVGRLYSITDLMVAADAFARSDTYNPTDTQSVLESLLAQDSAQWTDITAVSDPGSGLILSPPGISTFTELLVVTDAFNRMDTYSATDALSVLDLPVLTSSPTTPTWITRDGRAVWVTRDGQIIWVTRDENAQWAARDDKATWDTRDDTVTWKARF